jgi:hypothetical protein
MHFTCITPLIVEVLGVEPNEQEVKAIYSLKLECLCTTKNKETNEIDLVMVRNKLIKQGK